MSFSSERISIESRLQDNWTTTAVKYDNIPFVVPSNASWIRLSILDGDSRIVDLAGLHRRVGVIIISIFTQKNTGTATARGYADTLAGIYRTAKFEGITCWSPTIVIIGEQEEFYQINVKTPFYIDEQY